MVKISTKEYNAETGQWSVDCIVELASGTRSGVVTVTLPEYAADQELQDAIVAVYEPAA